LPGTPSLRDGLLERLLAGPPTHCAGNLLAGVSNLHRRQSYTTLYTASKVGTAK